MISQTAEYALRAVVYLASQNGSPTNRAEIARATHVPTDYLHKVLLELEKAHILVSQRGPGGGYTLCKSAEPLTVYDVVAAVESIPRIERCPLGIEGHGKLCPLHRMLDEAAAMIEEAFRRTKISQLVAPRRPHDVCPFPLGSSTD